MATTGWRGAAAAPTIEAVRSAPVVMALLGSLPARPAPPPAVAGVLVGVAAHRGASHEAPENALAALDRAWALGAEACEVDARITGDGHVVLMHDDSAHR